jgi:hypothetical protein
VPTSSSILGLFFGPEDGGDIFVRNVDLTNGLHGVMAVPEDGTLLSVFGLIKCSAVKVYQMNV